MLYSTVDSRPIWLALKAGTAWYNWAKSQTSPVPIWETPFSSENHLLACTPDPLFPTIQEAVIPDAAILQASGVYEFAGGKPISVTSVPGNAYLGPYPTSSTLR